MEQNIKRYVPYAIAGVTFGAAAYAFYRWYTSPTLAPHIKENLPVSQKLKTIPDVEGNYDIDGVSFDAEGVIVSSDDTKAGRPSLLTP